LPDQLKSEGEPTYLQASQRKLLEATGLLERARHGLLSGFANATDGSDELRRHSAQAMRQRTEALSEATLLVTASQRLIAESKALRCELE
jgi:hypothetical protein